MKRRGFSTALLVKAGVLSALVVFFASPASLAAPDPLAQAKAYYHQGQYFTAARYAYASSQQTPATKADANATVTLALTHAGLWNSATYFFIETLKSGDRAAIRRVLTQTEGILSRVGPDVLRNFLIRNTKFDDYDPINRSAYLFSLGKAAILKDDMNLALQYLNQVKSQSRLYPFSLEMRGTALTIQGRIAEAVDDFRDCQKYAPLVVTEVDSESPRYRTQKNEAKDLEARCTADEARAWYQGGKFDEAEIAYDRIPKASRVWPEILYEQAWNAFAKREFNRTLGKLVTYKAPALGFIFNSEVEVLRAQTYLALCLYDDTQKAIDEFNSRYTDVGREVKRFVESNARNLEAFYQLGVRTLKDKRDTADPVGRLANRFVRGPYFTDLVAQEGSLEKERGVISAFARMTGANANRGFSAFLTEVLKWRRKTIHQLGGAYVKNSLIDYHGVLVEDFEKISYIRLEMLGRAKDKLIRKMTHAKPENDGRSRGVVRPTRRDDQMFWTFNGEFWNDELGDYVFGLESECGK
jgi:tetratricopeptide (TPR) repeat protein